MKKIEKQLKKDAATLLPDSSLKEKIKAEAFGTEKSTTTEKRFNRKAAWISVAAACAAIILILTLTLVLIPQGDGGKINNKKPAYISVDIRNTYAFGAFSAGMLLKESGGAAAAEVSLTPEQVDMIGECLPIVEGLTSAAPVVNDGVSDRDDYAKKMTVSANGIAYVIYYNESAARQDDGEIKSSISGVISINGREFAVSGKREKETDKGESEYEITVTVHYGEGNYVVFEQEIETEGGETETSYAYTVVRNGVEAERFEMEIENEYDNTEISVETLKNGQALSFEYIVTGAKSYSVEVELTGELKTTVTVSVTENEYVVTYNGNEQKRYSRK